MLTGPPDQAISVRYTLDIKHKPERRGLLRLQNNSGNTLLAVFEELAPAEGKKKAQYSQIPEASFMLFNLCLMETHPNDVHVTLSSPTQRFEFSCTTMDEKAKFLEFIGQKVRIIRSDLNINLYTLESIDYGPSPFVSTVIPKVSVSSSGNLIMENKNFVPMKVNRENITADILYNADIEKDAIFTAFQLLLPVSDTSDIEYEELKKQWSMLIPKQYINHRELRRLMAFVEKELKDKESLFRKYSDPKKMQKKMFPIVLTYSLYNWDGAAFFGSVIDIMFPIFDAYIDQFGEDDENCESEVFKVFAAFWETHGFGELKNPKKQSSIQVILDQAGHHGTVAFDRLMVMLGQKHIHSLDFLRDDCSRWFIDMLDVDKVKILWISVLSYGNWKNFFADFITVLLDQLAPQLNELNPLSSEEFIDRFNVLKKGVDIRTLLYNAKEYIQPMFSGK